MADAAARPVPVVVVLPARQGIGPLRGVLVRSPIGPLAQRRLDKPLGLAIGLWPVRPCELVLHAQGLAGSRKLLGRKAASLSVSKRLTHTPSTA